jgi:hypothetical protein
VTSVNGRATLMSWGGTMFEYLMPLIVMRSFAGTLLDQSCRASVRRQMDYARDRRIPWGMSESAYAVTDRAGTYQYRAFGVPGLGLKRGLEDDLVVAPYATALAGLVNPAEAAANLRRLIRAGALGRYGFYESLDYGDRAPISLVEGELPARRDGPEIVRAFFSHHQGMSLVAHERREPRRVRHALSRRPRVQATELILQVRCPEAILEPRPADAANPDHPPAREHAAFRLPAHGQRAQHFPLERPLRRRSPDGRRVPARGAAWRSRAGATTAPRTPERTSSICAIRGPVMSGHPPICRFGSRARRVTPSRSTWTSAYSRGATATSRRLQIAVS